MNIDFKIHAEIVNKYGKEYTRLKISKRATYMCLDNLIILGYRLVEENKKYYFLEVSGNRIIEGVNTVCKCSC
ncbi:hypothetical protein [Clostridium tyrobutyricum]|uniref:hypothetical protein n=1 Tax=Clostridium tyrobutyricum TaxID=1519 RepID=UPI00242B852A|nr:hypothetical protein [Clostridium tyrobutyricum]MCH4201245.1 hypothetical protein [Clostridium tyrobutyricum]MCH4237526.1 hypothetical protein [Clostridium tyrobutyricum]